MIIKYAVKNAKGEFLQRKNSSNYVWTDLLRATLYIRERDALNKAKHWGGEVVTIKIEEKEIAE